MTDKSSPPSATYDADKDPHVLLGRIVDAATDLAHLVTAKAKQGDSLAVECKNCHETTVVNLPSGAEQAMASVPSETPLKVGHAGSPCPHGKPHELDGICTTCDCGKPTNAACCEFAASMLRGPLGQPALADRVLELIAENKARASAPSATPCSAEAKRLARCCLDLDRGFGPSEETYEQIANKLAREVLK